MFPNMNTRRGVLNLFELTTKHVKFFIFMPLYRALLLKHLSYLDCWILYPDVKYSFATLRY